MVKPKFSTRVHSSRNAAQHSCSVSAIIRKSSNKYVGVVQRYNWKDEWVHVCTRSLNQSWPANCLSINAPTMFYQDRLALEPIRQEWNSCTGRSLCMPTTQFFLKHISFVGLGVPVKSSAGILFSCLFKTEAGLIWQGEWWKSSYSWKNMRHTSYK